MAHSNNSYMAFFVCLLIILVSLSVGSCELVGEDTELERQLRILNKPAVKTILVKVDGIIDCVEFHKQPAFDHPLLKNRKLERRIPISNRKQVLSTSKEAKSILRSVNCPYGTVPILRTRKDDLIRARYFSQLNSDYPGQHVARMKSKNITRVSNRYFGIRTSINVQNPKVGNGEWSSAQVWIENGPNEELNTIQAGWAVSPTFLGDNNTRLFIFWNTDALHQSGSGCLNLHCQGLLDATRTQEKANNSTGNDLFIPCESAANK